MTVRRLIDCIELDSIHPSPPYIPYWPAFPESLRRFVEADRRLPSWPNIESSDPRRPSGNAVDESSSQGDAVMARQYLALFTQFVQ